MYRDKKIKKKNSATIIYAVHANMNAHLRFDLLVELAKSGAKFNIKFSALWIHFH